MEKKFKKDEKYYKTKKNNWKKIKRKVCTNMQKEKNYQVKRND